MRCNPGVAINSAQRLQAERPPLERFMRGLLRIGDVVDKDAIFGAHRSTTAAIVVAGIRCTITYLLIPILAPMVGLLDTLSAPISIALCVTAIVMGVAGIRRFWIADHRARWSYTAFMGVVLVLLVVAIVLDVWTILG